MRLVYFIEDITETGGVERTVIQKANMLSLNFGYDVTIISAYESNGSVVYPLHSSVRTVSLGIQRIRKDASRLSIVLSRFSLFAECIHRLNRELKRIDPDIVSFIWILGAMALPFVHTRARRVFESHLSRRNTPYKPFLFLAEKRADAVVCLTRGDAAEYHHCRRCEVIPNYIDITPASLPDYGAHRIVAMGRLMPVKGFSRLLRIWQSVIADCPDWHLDIYGIGEEHDRLVSEARALGISDSVHLQGRTDDVAMALSQHSIHVMTSYAEGQPMTLLEAQACALPSVTFDFDYGARDIITTDVNGILVAQNDEQAFAHALLRLMRSEDLRRRMGLAGQQRVASTYTSDNVMPLWQQLFASLSPSVS